MDKTQHRIELTPKAATRILYLQQREEKPGLFLRLCVESGGCSGFRYRFSLDAAQTGDDVSFEENGAILVIDKISLDFLSGSTIDYVSELSGEGFQVKNPNAESACGCGESFTPRG